MRMLQKAFGIGVKKLNGRPLLTTAKMLDDLREQTASLLEKRAEAFMAEHKPSHAAAAQQLANEIRRKSNV